ncbi:hypothetical protein ACKC9G_16635 [Pokkaliibacter sp. CJK22405]|uniref:hypothetical protein n=1 Tax=Pokkaliibacter sp. CJK22405 TaxID=3384615 RepID=UPI00398547FA
MGIIDRINQAIVKRADLKTWRLEANAGDLVIERKDESRRLNDLTLTSAVLAFRDIYVAETVCLRLQFASGENVDVFEDSPFWPALLDWLTQNHALSQPAQQSQIELMAEGPDAAPRELLTMTAG